MVFFDFLLRRAKFKYYWSSQNFGIERAVTQNRIRIQNKHTLTQCAATKF